MAKFTAASAHALFTMLSNASQSVVETNSKSNNIIENINCTVITSTPFTTSTTKDLFVLPFHPVEYSTISSIVFLSTTEESTISINTTTTASPEIPLSTLNNSFSDSYKTDDKGLIKNEKSFDEISTMTLPKLNIHFTVLDNQSTIVEKPKEEIHGSEEKSTVDIIPETTSTITTTVDASDRTISSTMDNSLSSTLTEDISESTQSTTESSSTFIEHETSLSTTESTQITSSKFITEYITPNIPTLTDDKLNVSTSTESEIFNVTTTFISLSSTPSTPNSEIIASSESERPETTILSHPSSFEIFTHTLTESTFETATTIANTISSIEISNEEAENSTFTPKSLVNSSTKSALDTIETGFVSRSAINFRLSEV